MTAFKQGGVSKYALVMKCLALMPSVQSLFTGFGRPKTLEGQTSEQFPCDSTPICLLNMHHASSSLYIYVNILKACRGGLGPRHVLFTIH